MTLSFPMNFKKNSVNVNITASEDSRTVGASGMVGDRFSYGASMSHQDYTNPSFNVNGRYRTNYTTVGGSYSVADSYQQAMVSLSGSVVAIQKVFCLALNKDKRWYLFTHLKQQEQK